MKNIFLLLIFILAFCCIQCNNEHPAEKPPPEKKIIPIEVPKKEIPKPVITYHLRCVDSACGAWFHSLASDDTLHILFALNRADKEHLLRQDSIVVPDTFVKDFKIYSPFPDSVQELKPVNKIIFFSYAVQAFAVYENGLLIRWGPVSMGKRTTPTPLGLFHTNWKSKQAHSTVDKEWIMNWYFNLDNFRGVSMHEYELPGYPASHACMRLLTDDATWFYQWADQWKLRDNGTISVYGTPVIIFGEYPFGKRKPWKALAENNKALFIPADSLAAQVYSFLSLILEQQAQREKEITQQSSAQ